VTVAADQADLLRRLTARRESMDAQWRDAIRAAIDAGGSLREVAELAGITHTGVKHIAHGRPNERIEP
jgi:hypothetical protein